MPLNAYEKVFELLEQARDAKTKEEAFKFTRWAEEYMERAKNIMVDNIGEVNGLIHKRFGSEK